jgi:hypothetical protein
VDDNIAKAGFRQALRTLPAAARVVLRLAWQTSPAGSGSAWASPAASTATRRC